MLIDTYDSRPGRAPTWRLRREGKGVLACYLIEPVAEKYGEEFRREIERNKIALLSPSEGLSEPTPAKNTNRPADDMLKSSR